MQFLISIRRLLFGMCIMRGAVKLSHPLNISKKNITNFIADSILEIYMILIVVTDYGHDFWLLWQLYHFVVVQ